MHSFFQRANYTVNVFFRLSKGYIVVHMGLLERMKNFFFAIILLITSLAIFVPFSPQMPREGLDPSWVFGMNQAIGQGLVLGRDIVFTFGPYASIYTMTFHPATDHLMVWGGGYLGLSFFVVAFLNFRATKWHLRVGLLFVLAAIMYSRDPLFFFYPLLVGIYLYKEISSGGIGQSYSKSFYLLLFIMFSPLGLLPLIKGSALVACFAIIVFCCVLLFRKRNWLPLAIICISPVISTALFWILADQPLSALPEYFHSMVPIISGYTAAMSSPGNVNELVFYLTVGAGMLLFLFLDLKEDLYNKSVVVLMFFVVLFLSFKAGFVRHDGHAIIPGTMILLLSILLGTLICRKRASIVLLAAFLVWGYIDANHIKTSTRQITDNIKSTYLNSWHGFKSRIVDKEKLGESFEERLKELKQRENLPLLNGTTDIYSYGQTSLFASGNKWNPRPIFQSYSVYTPKLAEKNKLHIRGNNRPDNIFFNIQPIDGRAPSIEDGASWPVLISNYQPARILKDTLLLKKRNSNYNLTYISKETHSLGEKIDLPSSGGVIFAKVSISPTLIGRIFNILFKTSQLEIKYTMENGSEHTYRFIPNMAEQGFIISPLIENVKEFGLLYAGSSYLSDKNVKSIKIATTGTPIMWRSDFELEYFLLNYKETSDHLEFYEFSHPFDGDGLPKLSSIDKCEGTIDSINGVSPAPSSFTTSSLLKVHGWLAKSIDSEELPDEVYMVLTDVGGMRHFIKTKSTQRPDVGRHFNNRRFDSAGYSVTADVSMLNGDYTLGLAYLYDGSLSLCPKYNVPVTIHKVLIQ